MHLARGKKVQNIWGFNTDRCHLVDMVPARDKDLFYGEEWFGDFVPSSVALGPGDTVCAVRCVAVQAMTLCPLVETAVQM